MSPLRFTILAAWALAGLGLAGAAVAWSMAVPVLPPEGGAPAWRMSVPAVDPSSGGQLDAAAISIREHNPFWWERKPKGVRFNPWEEVNMLPTPSAAPPSKPVLALVGIVGGPPWTAVIEGIPGREGGVLLRAGEEVGGLRLADVRGDTVRLSGHDTTWTLTPRRAWP
jgi:hypothetical protein